MRTILCDPAAFSGFRVSRAAILEALGCSDLPAGTRRVALVTSPEWCAEMPTGRSLRAAMMPYPDGARALCGILQLHDPGAADRDGVDILLPKAIFADLAERCGAHLPGGLVLGAGVGNGDAILAGLRRCFTELVHVLGSSAAGIGQRLADALNTHLAERYGGMCRIGEVESGGLAPWQLRRALRVLGDLQTSTSIDDVARDCGLSTGHFARAFKRSMGKSPYQWALHRRVEAAKEMLGSDLSLAEVAVACRFSDQSHLTRAFSQATGVTPGRWRAAGVRPSIMAM